jgi:hypothetical protein
MFDERGLDYAINLLDVAFVQGRKDRALVREVLVDRTDTHPCHFGDTIRRDGIETLALQYPDYSFKYCVDCLTSAALLRAASNGGSCGP